MEAEEIPQSRDRDVKICRGCRKKEKLYQMEFCKSCLRPWLKGARKVIDRWRPV